MIKPKFIYKGFPVRIKKAEGELDIFGDFVIIGFWGLIFKLLKFEKPKSIFMYTSGNYFKGLHGYFTLDKKHGIKK